MTPIKLSALGDLTNWPDLNQPWWDLVITVNLVSWEPVHTDIINHVVTMRKIVYGVDYHNAIDLIKRRRGQMFVHSHLYYNLDHNIISDAQFDYWAKELAQLQQDYPGNLGFYDKHFKNWNGSTGFHLKVPTMYRILADSLFLNKDTYDEP